MNEKTILKTATLAVFLASSAGSALQAQTAQPYQGVVGRTLAESKEWWPTPTQAPASAPNIIWILLDDVGYGASDAFGGLIETPTLDTLANNGLRYTNFHTTAICAPTRSALLTGRNSASVHVSGFSHTVLSAGFPGWDGRLPSTAGTVAEILRDNGYNTFAVGKYGVTPDEEATDAGPFDHWPTGKGFDHFFGFLGSQTDQYKPDLVEDQAHVRPDGRHLSAQITDKAISYIDRQKKVAPNKPFFLYYAPGATHAPHQVDKSWSDQYKGKFDAGWDAYRDEVFKRQKKLGVIPANAQLPDRNPNIKPWDTLPPEEKKLYARFMEVYAGYLAYTDYEISRLVNHLKESGQLDNTLIFISVGDNGASKEGTLNGDIDRSLATPPLPEKENIAHNLAKIGEIGTPEAVEGNYPLGWAQAADTPFKQWKQDANAEGGTHNPLIVYWPKGIKDKGGIRPQYSHVIDLLPTTLDLIGVKAPEEIRSVKQQPIEGVSFADSIDNANAPWHHTEQYYYIFGSRAIYKDGWKAGLAYPSSFITGNLSNREPFDENAWELYNLNDDPTERIDLAKKNPEKLAELKAEFEAQAKAHNVYPLITWDDVLKGRIHATKGRKNFFEAVKDITKAGDNQ
ncbi:sulfatase [Rhodoblastus sphagnicola]|uniref:Sulfatase n=1 Tax=Rhodoblastus sphagnicola TaxID=333368 RepID=A0A2S6MX19_9HYPH|nr:arylsulfatase [Rhodoblastus sphagnicola]MBB4199224.1 arylsulfatase [Rhodoblastus sphagnicola]PPQ26898.1 sulfatase [Rhodoblastus sphagnicola]